MSDAKFIPTSFVCLILAGLALMAGCDRQPTEPIKYPTKGILTNNGQPVLNARVVFYSTELGISRSARTGPDGRFVVRAGTGNGLPAGTYHVVVQAASPSENPEAAPDENRDDIPEVYRRKSTTPLIKTIEDGDNQVEIDLSN